MGDPEKKVQPLGKNIKKSELNQTKEILSDNIKNKKSANANKTVSSFANKTNIKLSEKKDENKKIVNNHKTLNNFRTKYQPENNKQKYIIKIINFVAIHLKHLLQQKEDDQ